MILKQIMETKINTKYTEIVYFILFREVCQDVWYRCSVLLSNCVQIYGRQVFTSRKQ